MKILVIDNDRDRLDSLSIGVLWGFRCKPAYLPTDQPGEDAVLTAQTGEEALRLFGEHEPNLVLLNVAVPGWSDLLQEIRRTSSVPVLLLAERTAEHERLSGLKLGVDDYVLAPYTSVGVLERIRALLLRGTGTKTKWKFVLDKQGQVRIKAEDGWWRPLRQGELS